jgi:Cu(I)/Ag(I) efflux system membrane protein CusA/SilA
MYGLGHHYSVASAIGFIALAGVAVEVGVVMMLFLDRAIARRAAAGTALSREELHQAVVEGALLRLRPATMTKVAIIVALLPIMLGGGAGSEAMQRIAAPMLGGMVSVAILTLAVIPAAFLVWKRASIR